ncbi:MAG: 50S ribosomal protein L37ae [Nanoarchaeota archaeon]|nr:50S ribosomal protein L37ae [Nanoarchaeota archaeon]MBU1632155.1 50S ribosomal protein L37ae [Nanoarchaeota archaeon]MBU1876356.1 50S ribosomal protein L37ae [Nanoarchaeota archaeon]
MPTKRFGARYGRSTKSKFAKIESQQRAKHKCPSCNKTGVKRVALGIWQCRYCEVKFTGKAYSIS